MIDKKLVLKEGCITEYKVGDRHTMFRITSVERDKDTFNLWLRGIEITFNKKEITVNWDVATSEWIVRQYHSFGNIYRWNESVKRLNERVGRLSVQKD